MTRLSCTKPLDSKAIITFYPPFYTSIISFIIYPLSYLRLLLNNLPPFLYLPPPPSIPSSYYILLVTFLILAPQP